MITTGHGPGPVHVAGLFAPVNAGQGLLPLVREPLVTNTSKSLWQASVDLIPNLLITTLVAVASLPVGKQVHASAPQTVSRQSVDVYNNILVLGYPTIIPAWIDFDPVPALKSQNIADQYVNTLVLRPVAAKPFNQLNWPVPISKSGQNTVDQLTNVLVLESVTKPFALSDWTFTSSAARSFWQPLVDNLHNSLLPIPPIPPPSSLFGSGRYGGRVILPPKRSGESVTYIFDFISSLGPAETILTQVVMSATYSGTDPSPTAIISGTAAAAGTQVAQRITAGVLGVIYKLLCTITTNLGNTIELSAYLAIIPDVP